MVHSCIEMNKMFTYNLSKFDNSLSLNPNSERKTWITQNSNKTNNAVIIKRRK